MKYFNRTIIDPILLSSVAILFPMYTIYWIATHFNLLSLLMLWIAPMPMGHCISMFAHRAWAHKSWTPGKALNFIGLLLFTCSLVGNSIGWVSIHREHHRFTDTAKDPHSPYFMSRLRVQFLSYFSKIKIEYIADLIRQPIHVWFAKNYWYINGAVFLTLYLISTDWLCFWIAVSGSYIFKMNCVNSLCHKTPWSKDEGASNSLLLLLFFGGVGEAIHKNHHEDPKNWNFSKRWFEVDITAGIIYLLSKIGLAKLNH